MSETTIDESALTIEQVAAVIGVTSRTIYRMVHEGRLPFPHRPKGGGMRWRMSEILVWQYFGQPSASGFERLKETIVEYGVRIPMLHEEEQK